jgi:protein phosphatase
MSISFLVGNRRVRFAGKTDVGRVRAHNEDDLLLPQEMALCAISDGMGGHACGEVASRITVETIERHYRRTAEEEAPTWPFRLPQIEIERNRMVSAIKMANSEIFDQAAADSQKKGMGCTVDALYFAQGRFYVGHVGDSRVYRFREGQLTLVTEDHSLLNDYRRMKEMSAAEIEAFPHKNVVVRALGLSEHVAVDVIVDEYLLGDTFLLCSDGLSDMLDDDEICEVMQKRASRLDGACSALIDAANEAGGKDNITAMIVQVVEA